MCKSLGPFEGSVTIKIVQGLVSCNADHDLAIISTNSQRVFSIKISVLGCFLPIAKASKKEPRFELIKLPLGFPLLRMV